MGIFCLNANNADATFTLDKISTYQKLEVLQRSDGISDQQAYFISDFFLS